MFGELECDKMAAACSISVRVGVLLSAAGSAVR